MIDYETLEKSLKVKESEERKNRRNLGQILVNDFNAEHDAVVAWDDPDIGVRWPLKSGRLSQKDAVAQRLRDVGDQDLPRMAT